MNNDSSFTSKYQPAPLNLENPKNAHDFQVILTGKNKKVLEIGTSWGYITRILKQNGCHVTGIEMDESSAYKAAEYTEKMIVGDIENLNLSENIGSVKYDVILIGDVLEHLREPKRLLQKLTIFLTHDGYIVCSIPNIAHGSIRLRLLNGIFKYQEIGLLDETHLHFYTLDTIQSLFRSCGYSIVKIERVKEDLHVNEDNDIAPYEIPKELLESILRDMESTTFQYVVKAVPSSHTSGFDDLIHNSQREIVTNNLNSLIREKDQKINALMNDIQKKDLEIKSLQKSLNDVIQSTTWKILKKYDKVKSKLHIVDKKGS